MLITATQTNTRQAPRKVRLVANAVRKLPLTQALRQLAVMERRASIVVLKTLRQAIANAQHNHNLRLEDLVLKNITVDGGPQYKRFRAVSRGRGHGVLKKTSHVRVELEQLVAAPSQAKSQPAEKTEPTKESAPAQKTAAKTADKPKKAAVSKAKTNTASKQNKVVAKK